MAVLQLTPDRQTFLVQQPRRFKVADVAQQVAEVAQRMPDCPLVTEVALNREALFLAGAGGNMVALIAVDDRQIVQRERNASAVAKRTAKRQALLVVVAGGAEVALKPGEHAGAVERLGADRTSIVFSGRGEHCIEPCASF